jgi:hypothetical protein
MRMRILVSMAPAPPRALVRPSRPMLLLPEDLWLGRAVACRYLSAFVPRLDIAAHQAWLLCPE